MAVILITTFLLVATGSPSLPTPNSSLARENPPYSLFAALPGPKQVLGYSVGTGDSRVVRLRSYLNQHNSPLSQDAQPLIDVAEKYQLPWSLIPAIAGKESGFCRVVPAGSHNCWGWAVYTGQSSGAAFDSYPHAIETIAKGLKENYLDQGLTTIADIETRYTPQSALRDNSWKNDVEQIMRERENWGKE